MSVWLTLKGACFYGRISDNRYGRRFPASRQLRAGVKIASEWKERPPGNRSACANGRGAPVPIPRR